jgi:hypothetical protein
MKLEIQRLSAGLPRDSAEPCPSPEHCADNGALVY